MARNHRAAQQIGTSHEDEPEFNAAISRICDIEHEIADIPATGPVGFSVKTYLACHYEHSPRYGDDPAGVALLTEDAALDPDEHPDDKVDLHCIAAVIRDAARFVPEIGELARNVIAPDPADIAAESERVIAEILRRSAGRRCGPAAHADPLLTAEADLREAEARYEALPDNTSDAERDAAFRPMSEAIQRLYRAPPQTLAGAAAKLRMFMHPALGHETGERVDEANVLAIGQVLEFLESVVEGGTK